MPLKKAAAKRKNHKPDIRLIRKKTTYTVPEAAQLLDVSASSIWRWISKEGLRLVDGDKPYLIMGADLYEFLSERSRKRRQRCCPGQLFCFRCQAPRRVALGSFEITQRNGVTCMIGGKCAVCGLQMWQRGSERREAEYLETFDANSSGLQHINATCEPIENEVCDHD